ncbi:hypothetical protein GCM10009114_19990 [Aliiglaciecola litoralis]|uniref:Outer membrane protein assembly factor BamB, contains PQQ-like beta-propeller repeat n=2 Tax=Aliiglaciecola litoralis TaxID=582857 RepID=A0ABN1LJA2_9ALTE
MFQISFSLLAANGDIKWTYQTDEIVQSTVAIDKGDNLIFNEGGRKVTSLDKNGVLNWSLLPDDTFKFIDAPIIDIDGNILIISSSLLKGQTILESYSQNGDKNFRTLITGGTADIGPSISINGEIALVLKSGALLVIDNYGRLLWRDLLESEISSRPIFDQENNLYVASYSLQSFNMEGQRRWSETISRQGNSLMLRNPVVGLNNTVIVDSSQGMASISMQGMKQWIDSRRLVKREGAQIVGPQGEIYQIEKGELHALRADGSLLWITDLYEDSSLGVKSTYPVITKSRKIIVSQRDSGLTVLNNYGDILWQKPNLSHSSFSPTVTRFGDIIMATDDKQIMSIESDAGSLSDSPWPKIGGSLANNNSAPLWTRDFDYDGLLDEIDDDIDNDNVANQIDGLPYDPLETLDTDGDGVGNLRDLDDDNDGIPDLEDNEPTNNQYWDNVQRTNLLWKFEPTKNPQTEESIALDTMGNTYVVSGNGDGRFYKLSPSGKILWLYNFGTFADLYAPVIADNGDIYVSTGKYRALYAFKPDGQLKWTQHFDLVKKPVISPVEDKNGKINIVGGYANQLELYQLDPLGTILRQISLTEIQKVGGIALAADGSIYITATDNVSDFGRLIAIDSLGNIKWQFHTDYRINAAPSIGQFGTVFFGDFDNTLYAVYPNGSLKWKYQWDGEFQFRKRPTISKQGDLLVGGTYHFASIDRNGLLNWQYQLSSNPSAATIGSDGSIFITDVDYIWRFSQNGEILSKIDVSPYKTSPNSPATISSSGVIHFGTPHFAYSSLLEGIQDSPWPSELQNGKNNASDKSAEHLPEDLDQDGVYDQIDTDDDGDGVLDEDDAFPWDKTETLDFDGDFIGDNADQDDDNDGVPDSEDDDPKNAQIGNSRSEGGMYWSFLTNGMIKHSSPVVDSLNNIYFGSDDGNFYAMSKDGQLRWVYEGTSLIRTAPLLVDDKYLYFGDMDGLIVKLDLQGSVIWKKQIEGNGFTGILGLSSDRTSTIYVTSRDFNLYAIDFNGNIKWSLVTGGYINSNPSVAKSGTIYTHGWKNVYSIAPSGDINWVTPLTRTVTTSISIDKNENIFFGLEDGKIYSFSKEGNKRWEYFASYGLKSSPAIDAQDNVYFAAGDKGLFSLSNQGELNWNSAINAFVESSPIITSKGYILIGDNEGRLSAFSKSGSLKWQFATDAFITSAPSIDNGGQIYLASNDHKVYSINSQAGGVAAAPWPKGNQGFSGKDCTDDCNAVDHPAVTNDTNGDGNADILWRNSSTGQNWLWTMNGRSIVRSAGINVIADQAWQIVGRGDFDGDGKSDILWRNGNTGRNYIYLMDGFNIKQHGQLNYVVDSNWKVAEVADFDGDGKDDILWRHAVRGDTWMYLMDGMSARVSQANLKVADLNWEIVASGDVNGDDKADLIWRHKTRGDNYIWLMNGTTITNRYVLNKVASSDWTIAGAGDLNGDGCDDIIWRNQRDGRNWAYLMNGGQIQTSAMINSVANTHWQIADISDLNGDGKADLFWRQAQSGQSYIYLMNGMSIDSSGYSTTVNPVWQVIK